MPVQPHLRRVREVAADLDEAGAELAVVDVEVVDAHPPLRLLEGEVGDAGPVGAVAALEHPLELLRGDDRDHTETPIPLCPLQIRPHMVELAIVPAAAIRLLQMQDRDLMLRRKRPHLTAEAIADPREQDRRRHRVAEMPGQKLHHLPAHLQPRHVRVQIQPIDALHLERHMTLEHLVDVRHARHPSSVHHDARACHESTLPGCVPLVGYAHAGRRRRSHPRHDRRRQLRR